MRLQKLRDFLIFYKEADLWAEYKDKNISTLAVDVRAYEAGISAARAAELKQYSDLKKHFLTKDVGGLYARYMPFEPEALALIQKNHDVFIASWPKDIRGERTFLQSRIESFKTSLDSCGIESAICSDSSMGCCPNTLTVPKWKQSTNSRMSRHCRWCWRRWKNYASSMRPTTSSRVPNWNGTNLPKPTRTTRPPKSNSFSIMARRFPSPSTTSCD